MGEKFVPKGPKRYAHQRRGLMKMIETKGVCALLFDPGTGKTMTTLDYLSLLALKAAPNEAGIREVRVLVTAPLAAVDTWVDQAERYVTNSVQLWAEALGGSVRQRSEALAARGGRPYANSLEFVSLKKSTAKRHPDWPAARVAEHAHKLIDRRHGPRGPHTSRSIMLRMRSDNPVAKITDGPDGLGAERARLVIEVVNLDTFSVKIPVSATSTTTSADVIYDAVKRFSPDVIVVDESHKIKGVTSNVGRMVRRLGKLVDRRIILTGTVMPVGPLDVWGQWAFLNATAFGDLDEDGVRKTATFEAYRTRYAEMGGWDHKQVISYQNLDDMQRVMAINAEVAKKSDALDLPPALPAKIRVDLSPGEKKAYDEMKKGLRAELSGGGAAVSKNKLGQMMKLRQITSGFVPDENKQMVVLGDSKNRVIDSLVNDTLVAEKRVVVFCLFIYEVEALRKKLARTGTEIMVITGATKPTERKRLRDRFGSADPQRIVMIAQVATMSLSVNELVTACNAVYGSLPQKRDDFVQSMDRLDRIGQTRPVTFWFALAPGTVDEVIYNAHKTRTSLEDAVLRHIFDDAPDEDDRIALEARRSEDEHEQVGRLVTNQDGSVSRSISQEVETPAPAPEEVPA